MDVSHFEEGIYKVTATQRTGEGAAENSGVIELIVVQGRLIENTGFTFTPAEQLRLDSMSYGAEDVRNMMSEISGAGRLGAPKAAITGGETRYRPPERVQVSTASVHDVRVIAAFRFAMGAVDGA